MAGSMVLGIVLLLILPEGAKDVRQIIDYIGPKHLENAYNLGRNL